MADFVRGHYVVTAEQTRLKYGKVVLVGEDARLGKKLLDHIKSTGQGSSGFFTFHTTKGDIQFNLVDVTGKDKPRVRRYDSYTGAKGAIIMCDCTKRVTYKKVPIWYKDLGGIPVLICVNNPDDIGEDKITNFPPKENLEWCDINVESGRNCEEPFLKLARLLTGDPNLEFT